MTPIRHVIHISIVLLLVLATRMEAHEHRAKGEATPTRDTTRQVDVPAHGLAQSPPDASESSAHPHEEGSLLDGIADSHAALVHFPIAWVILLVLLDAWTLAKGRDLLPIGQVLAVLAALSFLPAAVTGLLHAGLMDATPDLQRTIDTHRVPALASALSIVVAAGLRSYACKTRSTVLRASYLGLVGLATLLVLSAGYWGGIIARS